MVKKELIERSPLRELDGKFVENMSNGDIVAVVARKGAGKTPVLVHVALDQLLQGKHIIHLSFGDDTSHITGWYEDIFKELSQKNELANAMDVHDDVIKNRIIMNFSDAGNISVEHIEDSAKQIVSNGDFNVDTMIVDGYSFKSGSPKDIKAFKAFAQNMGFKLWFSVATEDEKSFFDGDSVPEILSGYVDDIDVILALQPVENHVHLHLVKNSEVPTNGDTKLKLDPQTLLVAYE